MSSWRDVVQYITCQYTSRAFHGTGPRVMSRTAVALANGVGGRQWSRRWKKRGDGSAYSMLNSISKAEQLMAENLAAASAAAGGALGAGGEEGEKATDYLAALIQRKAEIRMLSAEEIRALPGACASPTRK